MMRRLSITLASLVAIAVTACAGGPTPSPVAAPTEASSAAPAASASAASALSGRSAPDTLLRYWAFDAHPQLTLYADLGGLLRTELGRAIVPAALSLAKGTLTEPQAQCLRGAADSVKDLVVGADDAGGLVIARFDDTAFDVGPCLAAAGARAAQVEGAKQAFDLQGTFVVHEPGVLVIGAEHNVVRALRPRSGASTFSNALSLGADEYVAWSARVDEDTHMRGTLLASSERFRLVVDADVPALIADQVDSQFRASKGLKALPGLEGEESALAAHLLQSVDLKRDGSHLKATLDLHEPPADQARDLGMMASLGIAGVRKYLVAAKSAEARNTVSEISKDYVVWWEREENPTPGRPPTPRSKRKLVSFPPVPRTVPSGVKVQTTPGDWKPWDALRFQMDSPQYYQYEVRAAKDGKSADVIARGDLDGDGKQSEFRVHIATGGAGGALVIGQLVEHDPDE